MPKKLSLKEKKERDRCNQINRLLRRAWSKDPERFAILNDKTTTRPYKGKDKRIKREHKCNMCEQWVSGNKNYAIDHIEPVGSFKYMWQLPQFVLRLFCSRTRLQKLCKDCHNNRKTPEDIKTIKSRPNEFYEKDLIECLKEHSKHYDFVITGCDAFK